MWTYDRKAVVDNLTGTTWYLRENERGFYFDSDDDSCGNMPYYTRSYTAIRGLLRKLKGKTDD